MGINHSNPILNLLELNLAVDANMDVNVTEYSEEKARESDKSTFKENRFKLKINLIWMKIKSKSNILEGTSMYIVMYVLLLIYQILTYVDLYNQESIWVLVSAFKIMWKWVAI